MKLSTKLLTASAIAAVAFGAASAASATVFISFDGSTTLATLPDGVYAYGADCGVVNCGGFQAINVTGDTGLLPTLLHSQNVDATTQAGAAADITVYVTRTDISSPDFHDFLSSFTSNNAFKGGVTPFTVTMSTLVDPTNGLFGGNLISTFTTSGIGAVSNNQDGFSAIGTGGGTYSVTEEYTIHANAFSQTESSSPSIIFSGTAVPEPMTWALMLVGFGGMGALLRNRRRTAAVAA